MSRNLTLGLIRTLLIISLFGLVGNSLCAFQEAPVQKTKYEFTDARISEADTLLKKRKYQEALDAYQKAYDTYEKERFYEGMVYAKERMGRAYRSLGKDSLSQVNYSAAAEMSREKLGPDHILESKAFLNNGIRAHRRRNFLEATSLLDSAAWIYEQSIAYDSAIMNLIIDYKYYTYFYSERSSDTLIKYLGKREQKLDLNGRSLQDNIILLTDYCAAYYMKGDFEKAVAYGIEAERISKSSLELINPFYYRDAAFNLARALHSQGEEDLALQVTEELISHALKNNLGLIEVLGYRNLKAIILNGLEEFSLAAKEFKAIIDMLKGTEEVNTSFFRDAIMNLGVCYQLMGEFERAEDYLLEALELEKQFYNLYGATFISRYLYLAQLFYDMEEFSLASKYYDSALRNSVPSYKSDILEYPETDSSEVNYEALLILRDKQLSIERSFDSNQEGSRRLVEASILFAKRTNDLLMANRMNLEAAQGRLFMSENFKEVYESALNSIYLLQSTNPDYRNYHELVDKFLSLTKSILFLEQSGELGQIQDDRLPSTLKSEYFKIKTEIDFYEQRFFDLKGEITSNDSLPLINSELLRLNAELKDLKDSLSLFFDYSMSDFSFDNLVVDNINNFIKDNDGSLIVEFFVGERHIFIRAKSQDSNFFERVDLNENFNFHFERIIKLISEKPELAGYQSDLVEFQESAHFLYGKLLRSVMERTDNPVHNILIIPDDFLSKLPFEALVSNVNGEIGEYRNLDFLIKNYTIGYQLSSKSIKIRPLGRKAPKRVFGVGFSGQEFSETRTGYGSLPGTEEEIRFLDENLEGDFYLGKDGTKRKFLEEARNYDILHLAIHGSADSANRYDAKLIFNGKDGILKTSDLYRADLNARLAILSACESGTGGINKGEGTFSIARGFSLVGIPSVVMSLWKVNDKVTSKLMMELHDHLSSGVRLNTALAETKRGYLSSSDQYTSHPYYWASFVSLGDDISFEESNSSRYLLLTALVLVLLIFYLRFRSAINKKRDQK